MTGRRGIHRRSTSGRLAESRTNSRQTMFSVIEFRLTPTPVFLYTYLSISRSYLFIYFYLFVIYYLFISYFYLLFIYYLFLFIIYSYLLFILFIYSLIIIIIIIILSLLANKISQHSGDERETAFLFQRVSALVQRYSSVLLHDFFVREDYSE